MVSTEYTNQCLRKLFLVATISNPDVSWWGFSGLKVYFSLFSKEEKKFIDLNKDAVNE